MIDPIALKLGPIEIHWYAICIMTGLILAVYLAMKEAPLKKISGDDVLDFILMAFPIAIIGARLYYVVFQWSYYSKHLNEIIAIWNGGIAIYGGLITGAIVLYVYCYYKVINPISFLDIAAPGVMIAQAIGRWGNFVNQEAYGKVVNHLNYLPGFIKKQMFIEGSYRVPTFLYESLWNVLGFVIIMSLRHRPKLLRNGEITCFYLIWYGCGRFVIEGMRTDSLMFVGLRVSQWLSLLLVILGIVIIIVRRKKDVSFYKE
ncbi:prolipoprotein diacylglyceryl transferase [Streptococcus urinalis FB127-CNA-2]|uniref:Phosphatidylglycerol--prolipoprotein diacylglyceryl transferase n=1 Tax=Streptococcus urinalis 2285-97 TaxID=764291 RepID=G5KHV9_9STRE|nr:prolipoprotein diacylglyceryl transferase [Streptococcus urinalis]EHJ56312.1 prolipoprotein diacylglyceryl transferase [Streptococcus urinalis 2285-97]EKS22627.1 prolipoprotein diacylglyceryl transferase [Streptococcus urinalis FB127-CNA-2]VEF32396.1 prolipoprotein diacylglyceryl transferase [Streptococcus urinalis]